MVASMQLAFTNVPLFILYYRYNSACVIQKWLKFKRVVITARLACIS